MSGKTLTEINGGKTIKRLLRRQASCEYFKDGGWTPNPAEANHFSDVVEVAEICARYDLNDVELALRYEAEGSDVFCIPIR